MISHIRAEWLKLITTRAYLGYLGGAAVAAALFAFVGTAQGPPPWHITDPLHDGTMWHMTTMAVVVFSLLLGARSFTDEFRQRTIVHTFVADPSRWRSTAAKTIVSVMAAGLLTGLAIAVVAGVTYALAAATGGDLVPHRADVTAGLGMLAAAALWSVIGTGVGALVRNPVPVIAGGLLYVIVVENVAGGLIGDDAVYLPGQAANALAGVPAVATTLATSTAAMVIGGYALVLWVVGLATLRRRDLL